MMHVQSCQAFRSGTKNLLQGRNWIGKHAMSQRDITTTILVLLSMLQLLFQGLILWKMSYNKAQVEKENT